MNFYSVFGGCLESEIDFPELRVTDRREPRWMLTRADRLPAHGNIREIGDQHIYGDVHARLFRHDAGYRIVVDDTGQFDIDASGTNVVVEEKEGAWPDFVRAHVLGRVLATALYSRGWMPLHGSAVHIDTGVVGFLAPKGVGKSTLALALAHSGARLVTDDTLPVELCTPLKSWPGVPSVRIKADSLEAVGRGEADLETREGKGVVTSLHEHQLAPDPAPLSALYLVNPCRPEEQHFQDSEAAGRVKMESVPAALSILANFKLAKMFGSAEMPEVLRRASVIANGTPVYRLLVPRDLQQLHGVAETIIGWHSERAPAAAGRATERT